MLAPLDTPAAIPRNRRCLWVAEESARPTALEAMANHRPNHHSVRRRIRECNGHGIVSLTAAT